MHTCKPWTLPKDYMGAEWPDYYSAGFGQSRDSDALETSNFQVALRELDKLNTEFDGENTVFVVRESHWLVGWVEWIAIHKSNVAAIAKATELCESANDYPVLDEEHFSNVEMNEANEVWANCFDAKERIAYIREHKSQFEFHGFADLLSCVRGKYFAGYANELLA